MQFFASVFSLALLASTASAAATTTFPSATGTTTLTSPQIVSGTFDGGMKRFQRNSSCSHKHRPSLFQANSPPPGGCNGGEGGSADAVFHVQSGGTLQNVIIGSAQTEGVHCLGINTFP